MTPKQLQALAAAVHTGDATWIAAVILDTDENAELTREEKDVAIRAAVLQLLLWAKERPEGRAKAGREGKR